MGSVPGGVGYKYSCNTPLQINIDHQNHWVKLEDRISKLIRFILHIKTPNFSGFRSVDCYCNENKCSLALKLSKARKDYM